MAVLPTEGAHKPAGGAPRKEESEVLAQLTARSQKWGPVPSHVSESKHTLFHLLSGFKSSSKKEDVESGGTGMHVDGVNPCSPIYLSRANPEGCL